MQPVLGSGVTLYAASLTLLLPGTTSHVRAQSTPAVPYASISVDGEGYAGPGRDPANDLTGRVVRIGLLAPLHGLRKVEGDAMVAAAQMALRDTATIRQSHGRSVALVVEDASGPSWGMVSNGVIRLMLDDQVVAVITSTSRADTHLCEQVGNRIGVPVLTLSADPATTQIDIPWIFRIGASDSQQPQATVRNIGVEGDEVTGKRREFASDFRSLTGAAPTDVAGETYDAVLLVVQALRIVGPNRARIRDALAKTNDYDGVSGIISFDREGNNRAAAHWITTPASR